MGAQPLSAAVVGAALFVLLAFADASQAKTALPGGSLVQRPAGARAPKREPGSGMKRRIRPAPSAFSLPAGPLGRGGVKVVVAPAGLSVEYPVLAQDLGDGSCPPPALVEALQGLGSPPLRIGGDSQDMTVLPGLAEAMPFSWEAATLYRLPANFFGALHCLLSKSPDPVELGLNAKVGGLSLAQQMVALASSAIPTPLSFSIGNEPDLYYLPNYSDLSSLLPNTTAAAALYFKVALSIRPALGSYPLVGPELARPQDWGKELYSYIATLHPALFSVHLYPLRGCAHPTPSWRALLSKGAIEAPLGIAWAAKLAAGAHLPAVLGEANSASCGGVPGLSDSPAASVWAIGFDLSALTSGYEEVRFHASGAYYDPFQITSSGLTVRPLYYALKALNGWLAPGTTVQSRPAPAGLLLWRLGFASTRGYALLNYSETGRRITLPPARSPYTILLFTTATFSPASFTLAAPPPRGGSLSLPPRSAVLIRGS